MTTEIESDERGHGQDNPPALSVVVLTYNSASTIEACLDALAQQDFADFETIIVDDDSDDETVSKVSAYSSRLRLRVVRNGSNNIARGRNIGLGASKANLVAFIDSDDFASQEWTQVITKTFDEQPDLAVIAGDLILAYRSKISRAIGVSDDTVREFTAKGAMMFCAGNSTINRRLLPGALFDEDFQAAEDLEFYSRIRKTLASAYVPEMRIYHTSRDSLRAYAKQMFRYGFMKVYFGFCDKSFRVIDFVPLAILLLSIVVAAAFGPWWIVFAIALFSFLEAAFVVVHTRCRPSVAVLMFPVWLTKNLAWSAGVGSAIISLLTRTKVRRGLRAKRVVCP